MTSKHLVDLLRDAVQPTSKPAVLISGGLDSTILLHHLTEKTEEQIFTYTVGLPEQNEFEDAWRVAKHYESRHTEIRTDRILETFRKLIPILDKPRFNLWPCYAYEAANKDKRQNIYVGEGPDEHFGGYWERPRRTYQEYWGGTIEWSISTHMILAEHYILNLQTPFLRLDINKTLPYWIDPHDTPIDKQNLREAYKGIIPSFVLEKPKTPGRINWEIPSIWEREIQPYLNVPCPKTHQEANMLVNRWITEQWLNEHIL